MKLYPTTTIVINQGGGQGVTFAIGSETDTLAFGITQTRALGTETDTLDFTPRPTLPMGSETDSLVFQSATLTGTQAMGTQTDSLNLQSSNFSQISAGSQTDSLTLSSVVVDITSSGAFTFTAPVTGDYTIEIWGGGGGGGQGGSGATNLGFGGGGGAGGYARGVIALTAGVGYAGVVGSGGAGGTGGGVGGTGATGVTTSFSGVAAFGGVGGAGGAVLGGAGGAGGTGSAGYTADTSGNGRIGALVGTVTPTFGASGMTTDGVDRDDLTSGVNCGVTGFEVSTADGSMKVKATIRRSRTGVQEFFAAKSQGFSSVGSNNNHALYVNSTGLLIFAVVDGAAGAQAAVGTTSLLSGVDYDIEGEWTGAVIRVKVGGTQEGTTPAVTTMQVPDAVTPFTIARDTFVSGAGASPYPFQGTIKNVEMYRGGVLQGQYALTSSVSNAATFSGGAGAAGGVVLIPGGGGGGGPGSTANGGAASGTTGGTGVSPGGNGGAGSSAGAGSIVAGAGGGSANNALGTAANGGAGARGQARITFGV